MKFDVSFPSEDGSNTESFILEHNNMSMEEFTKLVSTALIGFIERGFFTYADAYVEDLQDYLVEKCGFRIAADEVQHLVLNEFTKVADLRALLCGH